MNLAKSVCKVRASGPPTRPQNWGGGVNLDTKKTKIGRYDRSPFVTTFFTEFLFMKISASYIS